MTKQTVSFRTDAERIKALDAIAEGQDRNRSYLINEAIDNYLDVQAWQREHIRKALAAADAGEIATDEEVAETFAWIEQQCT